MQKEFIFNQVNQSSQHGLLFQNEVRATLAAQKYNWGGKEEGEEMDMR